MNSAAALDEVSAETEPADEGWYSNAFEVNEEYDTLPVVVNSAGELAVAARPLLLDEAAAPALVAVVTPLTAL